MEKLIIDKIDYLLLFILQKIGRNLGKIEFAKLLYLIDVESIKLTGNPITEGTYKRDTNGPLHKCFYSSLKKMHGFEIEQKITRSRNNSSIPKHSQALGTAPRFEPEMTDVEKSIALRALRKYKGLRPNELQNLAYQTEPMVEIQEKEKGWGKLRGKSLNMDSISQSKRAMKWREKKKIQEEQANDYLAFQKKEAEEFQDLLKLVG